MKLRPGDFVVVAVVISLALAIWTFALPESQKGELAVISRDGKVIYSVPLSKDRVLKLPECEVRIEQGRAYVFNPTCPDKICSRCGTIENAGEIIICVPNRISVEISGNKKFDAIVS